MDNLQMHYLSSILKGKREISEEEARRRAAYLKLVLEPPFLVAEVAPYYNGIKAEIKDELIQSCADYVRSLLVKAGFSAYYCINEFDNVQVLLYSLTDLQLASLENSLIDVRNKLQYRYELDSFIGIGSRVGFLTEISSSANDASEMLAYKFTYAEQGVVNIQNLIRFSHSPNYASNIKFDRVLGCFQDGNIGKMSVRLNELIEDIRNKPNASQTSIRRTFIELTVAVLHVAANADVDTDKVINGLDIYQWILDQERTEILSEWFIKLCEVIRVKMQDQLESTEKNIIQNACGFIDEHIESLSLEQVSDAVGLSSYYFSKLFKKEKGIGFSNYISLIRISHAKQMLEETELPLTDIALQSGFSSTPYFSQVFKKQEGMTPGEYRRTVRTRN